MAVTVDPETMPQEELEWFLADRLEGLRETCPCLLGETRCISCYQADAAVTALLGPEPPEGVHPSGMDKTPEANCKPCRGLGYVPNVTLELLVVAAPKHYDVSIRRQNGRFFAEVSYPSYQNEASSDDPLRALSVAMAIVLRQEQHDFPSGTVLEHRR